MLQTIKKELAKHYSLKSQKGIFLSYFNETGKILGSHGVLKTDKNLGTVIDMIYHGIIKKEEENIHTVICDVVLTITPLQSIEKIKDVDISKEGLSISSLDHSKSGVMLPQTQGIESITQMLQIIKEKNNIQGNVVVYSFSSKKIKITV